MPNEQIKALGNLIGDVLWLLEAKRIKKSGSIPYIQKINKLIDLYAKQFDELLVNQEKRIFLNDLEKIENDNLKFYEIDIN